MSTDWHVHCHTCKSTHHFNDANHRDEEMSALVRHAAAIAALAPLVREAGVELKLSYYGTIDPAWFAEHRGHHLEPIDEYGGFLTQCVKYNEPGVRGRCGRKIGHPGSCGPACADAVAALDDDELRARVRQVAETFLPSDYVHSRGVPALVDMCTAHAFRACWPHDDLRTQVLLEMDRRLTTKYGAGYGPLVEE